MPLNIDNVSQNDIDELQLKIAELTSAESGKEKGQCFWYKYQKKNIITQTNDRFRFAFKNNLDRIYTHFFSSKTQSTSRIENMAFNNRI